MIDVEGFFFVVCLFLILIWENKAVVPQHESLLSSNWGTCKFFFSFCPGCAVDLLSA